LPVDDVPVGVQRRDILGALLGDLQALMKKDSEARVRSSQVPGNT
jgi:hypothetical protein